MQPSSPVNPLDPQPHLQAHPFNFLSHMPAQPPTSQPVPPPEPEPIANPFSNSITKRILTAPEYLQPEQIGLSYSSEYIKEQEYISGSENLFPILLEIIDNSIYICSKDSFIVFPIDQPSNYEKIKLPEMPTSFMAFGQLLFFGLRSGLIIVYNIISKLTLATCEEFSFPVIQLGTVDGDRIVAMDLCGNLKVFGVGVKIVGERVSKVSFGVAEVVEQFRIKKRDKLKNFVRNLPFRKDKSQPTSEIPQSDPTLYSPNQQIPKFCILPQQLRTSSHTPIIYYYKGQLKCLILDEKNTKISETTILQKIEGKLGMLQLGEGAFTNSNQSHTILVLSIDCTVHFYRQLSIQSSLQYIPISTIAHSASIQTGKFLSNNLLIFLTQEGIEIANVNEKLTLVHKLAYEKFGYIDFFNEEEGFNFDKRLLYGNVMRIGRYADGDCLWACIEGKRVVLGRVNSWQNYLNNMADNHEWEKCLKSALMIYKDKITLLSGIPQSQQQRNQTMQSLFQKITLTYLSYSLKNSTNPLQHDQIVRNVIDFMVRTECYAYLCTTLYEAVKGYGLEGEFFHQLEEYVESGSIGWMTDDMLMKVVKHYTTIPDPLPLPLHPQPQLQPQSPLKSPPRPQNRQHLETLITSFDLTKMQKSLLLFICLNNELYRSLIYICVEQADFVTPVVKLCGLRVVKGQEYFKLFSGGVDEMSQRKRERIRDLGQQLERLSSITFFYLRECLLGHNSEHNNPKSYLHMLQQLITFIFIPSSLLMLLQASHRATFELMRMLCGVEIMQNVLENGAELGVKRCAGVREGRVSGIMEELAVCGPRYYQHRGMNMDVQGNGYYQLFSQTHSQQFKIYNNMLSILTSTILSNYCKHHATPTPISPLSPSLSLSRQSSQKSQSELYLYELHNFLTHLIMSNSFPVRLGWRALVFQFGLVYPELLAAQGLAAGDPNVGLMRIVDSVGREVSKMTIEEDNLNKNLYTVLNFLLEPFQAIDKDKMDMFIPTKCYILDTLNRPKQIIQTLMAAGDQKVKLSVFDYLQYKIGLYLDTLVVPSSPPKPGTAVKPSLTDPLLSYTLHESLPALLQLSQTQTLSLLSLLTCKLIPLNLLPFQQLLKITNSLRPYPETQLQFIECIIRNYEQVLHLSEGGGYAYGNLGEIGRQMEMLAVRHLRVVVELCPQKLAENILKINYPLEQAFKVCEQCNNKTAMAYILIKSGRNQEGVLLICDLFSTNCRQVLRSLAKNTESEGTAAQMQKMDEQLEKILETCCHEYVNDVQKGEDMFEKVIERLFKELNPKVIDNIPIPKIRELLQNYIDKIISTTFSQVNPEFFIEKFSKNPKLISIPTRLYVQAYNLVCGRLGFKYEINFISKELLRESELKMYRHIVRDNARGVAGHPGQLCCRCGLGLYQGEKEGVQEERGIMLPVLAYNCGHKYHIECYNILRPPQEPQPQPQQQKQKSPEKSPTVPPQSPTKKSKVAIQNYCPDCKSKWQTMIQQELKMEADRFSVSRERKKSILIERKNKLAEFDCFDWFGVPGEVYGKDGQRVY